MEIGLLTSDTLIRLLGTLVLRGLLPKAYLRYKTALTPRGWQHCITCFQVQLEGLRTDLLQELATMSQFYLKQLVLPMAELGQMEVGKCSTKAMRWLI